MATKNLSFHGTLCANVITAVILPVGLYLNSRLNSLKRGDMVDLTDSHCVTARVMEVKRLQIGTPDFAMWVRLVYGEHYPFRRLEEEWREYCVIMGHGADGYSKHECFLLICEAIGVK